MRKLIFSEAIDKLRSGVPLKIYQTEKANGENASISYLEEVDKWIISSKNCSMILTDGIDEKDSRFFDK